MTELIAALRSDYMPLFVVLIGGAFYCLGRYTIGRTK